VEAQTALEDAIRGIPGDATVLVDCLTLWVNNLLYEAELQGVRFSEEDMRRRCEMLTAVCGARDGRVIFVTNEVGMGIVPSDPVSRLYRDLVGRCNQELAAVCGEVIFMAAGLPLYLKKGR
jgi:adenosylcobinamide kinase / adenosylcobinamide-phosphate guanylyltransferase